MASKNKARLTAGVYIDLEQVDRVFRERDTLQARNKVLEATNTKLSQEWGAAQHRVSQVEQQLLQTRREVRWFLDDILWGRIYFGESKNLRDLRKSVAP